jgi:hypothetical protein
MTTSISNLAGQSYLKESPNHPGEYYYSVNTKPGTLLYNVELSTLCSDILPEPSIWQLVERTPENLARVLPHTQDIADFTLIMIMKANDTAYDNLSIYKAAMLNTITGKISLMTSMTLAQHMNHGSRPIQSHDPDWFIGHYRMSAPLNFWRELSNRLRF